MLYDVDVDDYGQLPTRQLSGRSFTPMPADEATRRRIAEIVAEHPDWKPYQVDVELMRAGMDVPFAMICTVLEELS